ncbi:MAG TPA: hypothetical protein VKU89_05055 [Solirubrobacteraceae bacterium]|nr:hypothetical protein [Solirubrobacteraceae bacterium]
MTSAVHDLSAGSLWRTLRESQALIAAGLRARANAAAGLSKRWLAASTCAQGATVLTIVVLLGYAQLDLLILEYHPSIFPNESGFVLVQALMAASIAAALVGFDRISALLGFSWIGALVNNELAADRPTRLLALVLIPAVCYLVMLVIPRERSRDPRRLMWLAPALLLTLLPANDLMGADLGLGAGARMLLVLSVAGIFLLPTGSSLPLAFAVALIWYGFSLSTGRALLISSETGDVLRLAMITVGPLLLGGGAALRLARARRRLVG